MYSRNWKPNETQESIESVRNRRKKAEQLVADDIANGETVENREKLVQSYIMWLKENEK